MHPLHVPRRPWKRAHRNLPCILLSLLPICLSLPAEELAPTEKDIPYGEHELQKMDLYLPDGPGPFPYLVHIHAGGWWNGDKKWQSAKDFSRIREAGCAILAINYRFIPQARAAGIFPPVMGPFGDAKRALQYSRLHARELKLDPSRVSLFGSSAGACTALWLGLSPEMAQADSADPVERMSTRVLAIAGSSAQTSLDPVEMRAWAGENLRYGGHAFGLAEKDFEKFLSRREELKEYISKLSPAALVSADDPPIYLTYGDRGLTPGEKDEHYYVHSPHFGVGFQKVAQSRGAKVFLAYKGSHPAEKEGDMIGFLIGSTTKPTTPFAVGMR